MPDSNRYSDIPLSFTAHPMTGNIIATTDVDAVKQSVKNIVLTMLGERPYKPLFGGNINAYLFKNADAFTEYEISKKTREAITNWEPRVNLNDVVVDANPDSNSISVKIVFRLADVKDPITINVFLERVR